MRRRILILMAAAVLAGISALSVVAYGRTADRRALDGKQGVWVLLATDTIPANTTVADIRNRRLVRQVLMPAETVPDGALGRLDTSANTMKLTAPLLPDQMLLSGQFDENGADAAVPSPSPTFVLPANRIAISVELGIARQVAGNVDPGDEVTVFLSYPKSPAAGKVQYTLALLAKVPVVTVGEAPAPTRSSTPAPSPAPTATTEAEPTSTPEPEDLERYVVTLAVTQEEAEKLILGWNTGFLHLGVLGPSASVSPVSNEDLVRIVGAPAVASS